MTRSDVAHWMIAARRPGRPGYPVLQRMAARDRAGPRPEAKDVETAPPRQQVAGLPRQVRRQVRRPATAE